MFYRQVFVFCFLIEFFFIKKNAKTIEETNLQRLTQKFRKKYGNVGKDGSSKG